MFKDDTLKGRCALITGGGSGLGLGIANAYTQLGANVMIIGRNEDRLEMAVKQLQKNSGSVSSLKCDVRHYDQVKSAVEATVSRFGQLDILVNNAAGNFICPTSELTVNGWRTVIDIDLNGTFYGCHAAFPHLKRSSFGGSIINIITMLGVTGWPQAAHASAAKGGILSLSRTLAVEWGANNIRVNTISPGPIGDTEGVKRMYIDVGRGEMEAQKTALGRFGKTTDIANAAVYLASSLGEYVTGENLIVDGGRWLKQIAPSTLGASVKL